MEGSDKEISEEFDQHPSFTMTSSHFSGKKNKCYYLHYYFFYKRK